jgi:23S rRNA G2445 N2-methylase RlmL
MDNISVRNEDVIQFLNQTEHKFDVILADPPWGEFEKGLNTEELYLDFLIVASTKLNLHGKIVIISSDKKALDTVVIKSKLYTNNQLDVLISGKKVRVYCLSQPQSP